MSAEIVPPTLGRKRRYFHCLHCKKLLSSAFNLQRHLQDPKTHTLCLESTHDHDELFEVFDTMAAAKTWVLTKELDKTFSIAITKPKSVTYFCRYRRSRTNTPTASTSAKKRKVNPKPLYPCKAQFIIDKVTLCQCDPNVSGVECQNFREVARLRGCLHHSHDAQIRHQRVSKITKDSIITLLEMGVPKAVVMERYCFKDTYENIDYKPITTQDLYNFERLYINHEIDKKNSDFENLCLLMERSDLRAVSLEGTPHPPIPRNVTHKIIETNGQTLIVYASDSMINRFRKHPTTIFLDGTHGTNRSKHNLITLLVKDDRGEGTPIMQVIAESESSDALKPALNVLYRLAPDAVNMVQVLISDLAGAFVKAWREAFPNLSIQHIKCRWHLENAWKKQLLPQDAELYQCLRNLRLIPEEKDFWVYFY